MSGAERSTPDMPKWRPDESYQPAFTMRDPREYDIPLIAARAARLAARAAQVHDESVQPENPSDEEK